MQGLQPPRETLLPLTGHPSARAGRRATSFEMRRLPSVSAVAMGVSLALAAWPAGAVVVTSGDVSPVIVSAPSVDLTGQRIFLGFTTGGVGTLGTLTVNGGSTLTAAQITPGIGGLGTGIVNVTGAGSNINLTGGAASNGLDIGSWGTGTVTVSSGGQIVCSSPLACPFNGIGNGPRSFPSLNPKSWATVWLPLGGRVLVALIHCNSASVFARELGAAFRKDSMSASVARLPPSSKKASR